MTIKNYLKLLFIIVLFCSSRNYGQVQVVNFKVPDPIVTEQNLKNFDHFMSLAREAFISKDYDKTFYYLKQAEKGGWHNANFWYYMGISVYYRGNRKASKRYLKRGFYKYGCTHCNDAYEKLHGKKLKF